jgi:hypothetical protein
MDLKTPGPNYFMLRLALLIAPFGIVDRASAACGTGSSFKIRHSAFRSRRQFQAGRTSIIPTE